jgi:hypothetical protein
VSEWLAFALRGQQTTPPPELFMSQLAPLLIAA